MSKEPEPAIQRSPAFVGALVGGIMGGICGILAGGISLYCIAIHSYGEAEIIGKSDFPILAVQILAAAIGAAFGGISGGLGGAVIGSYWPLRRALGERASVALGLHARL